jgi:hypothetical protein
MRFGNSTARQRAAVVLSRSYASLREPHEREKRERWRGWCTKKERRLVGLCDASLSFWGPFI